MIKFLRRIGVSLVGPGATAIEWRTIKQTIVIAACLLAALGSTAWVVSIALRFRNYEEVAGAGTPKSFRELALVPSVNHAQEILAAWQKTPELIKTALFNLTIDNHFIFAYAVMFLCWATFACGWAYCWTSENPTFTKIKWARFHWVALIMAVVVLGGADFGENYCLEQIIVGANGCTVGSLRIFSQLKFIMLALVGLVLLLALGIAIRRECRYRKNPRTHLENEGKSQHSRGCFRKLIEAEQSGFQNFSLSSFEKVRTVTGAAGEPRVSRCNEDLVGLALSGGGIRSATFNLGLLQGLYRFDLLHHVDYLATVSGGGYIGGFWSRWLKENFDKSSPKRLFPDKYKENAQDFNADSRVFEAEEIRHLREFSKFLVPRIGIFETETWGAAVAMLAAFLPAVLAALSVLGLSLIGWLALTFYLAFPDSDPLGALLRTVFACIITGSVLWGMEYWWRSEPTRPTDEVPSHRVVISSILAVLLVGALVALLPIKTWNVWGYYQVYHQVYKWLPTEINSSYDNWWKLLGILPPDEFHQHTLIFIPRLYELSIAWGLVTLVFIAVRFRGAFMPPSLDQRITLPIKDRTTMRLLGMATFWALLATLWHIGINLRSYSRVQSIAAGGAAGTAAVFALLRKWIGQELVRPRNTGTWERIKPYIPQVLAYVTIGLAWAAIATGLIETNGSNWFKWYQAGCVMAVIVVLTLFVDPEEFGLHAVYRDRICRAYLGAAFKKHVKAADNRETDFRREDDLPLSTLLKRPLHLVCCAANSLGGDHLSTLSRGASSCVLSRYGVSLGNWWCAEPTLEFGSALTASAAAVNSNMGSVSIRLGPAVSFLMSALNLRLGLWVANPIPKPSNPIPEPSPLDRLLPGMLFFREMGAWTTTTGRAIHLSDGAHFDNLGLYELVRRHCRYIIMSDCTADQDVAFDDFGNTVRRIREDFDIEIEIDLDALRPGPNGRARQHAVVGSIDYGWFDKGTLVYIKPCLTGDEPVDVCQYKSRNSGFPHESTGDQFYDEAQWESYRRLGVHTANTVFAFMEHVLAQGGAHVQRVFVEAKQVWYPTPANLIERSLQMSERFSQFEEQIQKDGAIPMIAEIFPELEHIGQPKTRSLPQTDPVKDELANVGCLLRVMTLMEDTIAACSLQTHANHPMNLGWCNLFARWAMAPTFRKWWPLLKPMCGPGLRDFLEDRFVFLSESFAFEGATVSALENSSSGAAGYALKSWREFDPTRDLTDRKLYQYRVKLRGSNGGSSLEIQLAVAAVKLEMVNRTASWTNDHLFVPRSLWGSPLAEHFLGELLRVLADEGIDTYSVRVIGPGEADSNPAKWEERHRFVDFYRRADFRIDKIEECEDNSALNPNRQSRKIRSVLLSKRA